MAFTYALSGSKIGDTGTTTDLIFDGFDTNAGELLFIGFRWEGGGASDSATFTVSDTAGHTYSSRVYQYATGASEDTSIGCCWVLSTYAQVNNIVTVTLSAGRAYKEGVWARYSYTGAIQKAATHATGGSSSNTTPHTLSPNLSQVSGDLILGLFGRYNTGSWTAGTGFTERQDTGLTGLYQKILSASESTTVTATPSGSDSFSGLGIAFEAEGSIVSISATSSTGIQHWTGPLQLVGITKTLPILLGESRFEGIAPAVAWGKQVDILLGQVNAEGFTPSIAKAVTILLGETRAQGFAAQNVAIIRTFLGLLGELRALGFTVSSEPAQTANVGLGSANFTGLAAANIGIVAPASTITAVGLLRESQAIGLVGQVIRVVFPMTGTAHFDGYGAQTLEFIKVISGPDIGEMRAEGIAATAIIGQIRNYTISLGEVGFYALQQALTIQRTLDILVGRTNYTGIEPSLAIFRGGEINLGPQVGVVTLEGLINATANIERTAFAAAGLVNAEGFGAAAPAGQLSVQSVLGEMYASGFVPLVSFNRYFAQLGQVYASGFAPDISYGLWRPIKRRLTTWASI